MPRPTIVLGNLCRLPSGPQDSSLVVSVEPRRHPSRLSENSSGNTLMGLLGGAVSELTSAVSARVRAEIDHFGLDSGEFAVLQLFWEQQEWNTTQIALRLQLDAPRVSRLVAKLVDRRLLRRRHADADRRVIHLMPTAEGLRVMGELHERFEKIDVELLDGVGSQDFAGFLATVRTVAQNSTGA